MKYVKAPAPFALQKANISVIRIYSQQIRGVIEHMQQVKAKMLPSSTKMVLTSDIKALKPYPSKGAILPKSHTANVIALKNSEVINLHPDSFEEYVSAGIIDADGNYPPVVKKAPKQKEVAKTKTPSKKKAAPKKKDPVKAKPLTLAQLKKAYKSKYGKLPPKNWKKETIAKKLN
jgi:hypothetical protein